MRRSEDLPRAGDERLTPNGGNLLPKERYWDIPDTEEIKLDIMETTKFQEKDEGVIHKAREVDDRIQESKRNLDERKQEMEEIALGLCQWKDDLLWYQGKI